MTARWIRITALALVVAFTVPLAAQDRDVAIPEAEQAVREFFRAAVLGDREALARVILPHPNSHGLLPPSGHRTRPPRLWSSRSASFSSGRYRLRPTAVK